MRPIFPAHFTLLLMALVGVAQAAKAQNEAPARTQAEGEAWRGFDAEQEAATADGNIVFWNASRESLGRSWEFVTIRFATFDRGDDLHDAFVVRRVTGRISDGVDGYDVRTVWADGRSCAQVASVVEAVKTRNWVQFIPPLPQTRGKAAPTQLGILAGGLDGDRSETFMRLVSGGSALVQHAGMLQGLIDPLEPCWALERPEGLP